MQTARCYFSPACWRSSSRVTYLVLGCGLTLLLLLSYTKAEAEEQKIVFEEADEGEEPPQRSFRKMERRQTALGKRKRLVRQDSHAGAWYPATLDALRTDVQQYLAAAKKKVSNIKGLICPHDRYSDSGATAAWCYKQLQGEVSHMLQVQLQEKQGERETVGKTKLKTSERSLEERSRALLKSFRSLLRCKVNEMPVFTNRHGIHPVAAAFGLGLEARLLLPDSSAVYETLMGSMKLDLQILESLHMSDMFFSISAATQKKEHAVELQLPFLQEVFGDKEVKLVPIYCSFLNQSMVFRHAAQLRRHFIRPGTLFIVSTNLSVWKDGKKKAGETISNAAAAAGEQDMEGIKCLERQDYSCLDAFFTRYKNPFCGHQVLRIYLDILTTLQDDYEESAGASTAQSATDEELDEHDRPVKDVRTTLLHYSQEYTAVERSTYARERKVYSKQTGQMQRDARFPVIPTDCDFKVCGYAHRCNVKLQCLKISVLAEILTDAGVYAGEKIYQEDVIFVCGIRNDKSIMKQLFSVSNNCQELDR